MNRLLGMSHGDMLQQLSLFASHTDKGAASSTVPPKLIVEKINPPQLQQQQDLDGMKKELEGETMSYFKQPVSAKWKKYPELKLIGKYVGHQVCFFTMAPDKTSQAIGLTKKLRLVGFDAELKQAGEKPSIVVDLTTSKCAL